MKKTRFIPYGYTVRNGRTIIEHNEADIIREIFDEYIKGASLKDLAMTLTQRRIPYTEKTDIWDKSRIARIIDNSKYIGNGEYDPIIDEEIYESAVITKTARQRGVIQNECKAISVLRNRIKCDKCNSPMVRHINTKARIRESWTCVNPECGCRVRISDTSLLEKVNILINRIIENNELIVPKSKTKHIDTPKVLEIQSQINKELQKPYPGEEFIITKVCDIASQLYRESDAKLMITAQVAKRRASMMVVQEEFNPEYFADLISFITLDEKGWVKLITKTDTEISQGDNENESNQNT